MATAKQVADAAAEASKRYEDAAAAVFPPAAALVEVRDAIFKVADELGIGNVIRKAWFDGGSGARTGAFIGGAIETAATGAALGTGAAIGMVAGMWVGVVLAIFSLFGGSDEEDRQKRAAAEHKAELARMLTRMSAEGFAAEQDELARLRLSEADMAHNYSWIYQGTSEAGYRAQAETAAKFAAFYRALAQRLPPAWLELTISSANLARWQAFAAGYRQIRDTFAKMPGMQNSAIVAESKAMVPALESRIATEEKNLADRVKKAGMFVGKGRLIVPVIRPSAPALSPPMRRAVKVGAAGLAAWVLWRILAP